MLLFVIGVVKNDLRGSFAGDGIVEHILHHCVEILGDGIVLIVVNAAFSEDVSDLLPNPALTGTNGTDTLQQLTEVIFTESGLPLLQAIIVKDETLNHVLLQNPGGPNPEVGRPTGVDTVTYGDDGV